MMTKEAKVGLLLGLAFIIAIALVLKGIHQTGNVALEDELLAQNDDAQNNISLPESVNLSAVNQLTQTDIDQPPAEKEFQYQPQNLNIVPPAADSTVAQPDPDIRYEQPLPTTTETLANHQVTPPSGSIDRALEKITTPVENPGAIFHAANVIHPQPKQTYIVADGDDLSRIALKVYGQKEGNRWINIKRIYQANKNTLASMDEIHVGQKLTIPTLENQAITPAVASPTPAPAEKPARSETYTVKDGDSLWKIAQSKLGNGNRYPEIQKLNAKTLKNRNDLWVGMKLILPQK